MSCSNPNVPVRIIIPSIAGGFQGFTVANLINLNDDVLFEVVSHLHQYGETIGQKYAQIRNQKAKELLNKCDSLEDVAESFLIILPPVEHIIVTRGKEACGIELNLEGGIWAGYNQMSKQRLQAAQDIKENDRYFAEVGGDTFKIDISLMEDLPALEPAFTRFRMKDSMARIASSIDKGMPKSTVRRGELISVLETLERQISDGVKVQASYRALYVVEAILSNYAGGETRLHNAAARLLITKRLGRPAVGYQVAGKSSERLIKEISRLISGISFDAPTNAVLRARWRPANGQVASTQGTQAAISV
jgi:hypothetical protein